MNKNYRLPNDTAWPMPLDDDEIDLNCYHIETVTLTRHQAWRLRDIVGDLHVPESRLEASGRLAFLMSDGPGRWPDFFLKRENLPPDMVEAMRARVERSGPDLAVSSMVPREIDLGFIPEIADDTFDLFERNPKLKTLVLILLALLAGWVLKEWFTA